MFSVQHAAQEGSAGRAPKARHVPGRRSQPGHGTSTLFVSRFRRVSMVLSFWCGRVQVANYFSTKIAKLSEPGVTDILHTIHTTSGDFSKVELKASGRSGTLSSLHNS